MIKILVKMKLKFRRNLIPTFRESTDVNTEKCYITFAAELNVKRVSDVEPFWIFAQEIVENE